MGNFVEVAYPAQTGYMCDIDNNYEAQRIMCEAEQKTSTGRGRPRQFDPNAVSKKARSLFAMHGLAGTSLDELAKVTGLFRTSLAAAFKNKRGVFMAALEEYRNGGERRIADALAGTNVRSDLKQFFSAAISEYVGADEQPPGCFLMNSAVHEAQGDPEIGRAVVEHIAAIEGLIIDRIAIARDTGQIPATIDPAMVAETLTNALAKISILARSGVKAEALERIAKHAMDLVLGHDHSSTSAD